MGRCRPRDTGVTATQSCHPSSRRSWKVRRTPSPRSKGSFPKVPHQRSKERTIAPRVQRRRPSRWVTVPSPKPRPWPLLPVGSDQQRGAGPPAFETGGKIRPFCTAVLCSISANAFPSVTSRPTDSEQPWISALAPPKSSPRASLPPPGTEAGAPSSRAPSWAGSLCSPRTRPPPPGGCRPPPP